MAIAVEVSNLTCLRGTHKVLDQISFSLQAGELMLVEGSNGSGKTTLLRCLAGLVADYQGQIELLQQMPPLLVTHHSGLSGSLMPLQNLSWYAALRGLKPSQAEVIQALARVGMAGHLEQQCGTMSAGQQKRVVLARLLLEPADIWLLDEPMASLDEAGTSLVAEFCGEKLDAGGVVVVSAHQSFPFARPLRRLNLETASRHSENV